MEPAAARRRPTDVVAGAPRAPAAQARAAASGTAARGGRRRQGRGRGDLRRFIEERRLPHGVEEARRGPGEPVADDGHAAARADVIAVVGAAVDAAVGAACDPSVGARVGVGVGAVELRTQPV